MLKLEDLSPRKSYFVLKLCPGKKFYLRLINLEDEIWIKQTYPGERISEIFSETNPDYKEVCRIAWRLLINKTEFKKQKVKVVSDSGETQEIVMGGFPLLLKAISCMEDKISIMLAITETMGVSRKAFYELKKIIEGGADKKKIQTEIAKRMRPTGRKS